MSVYESKSTNGLKAANFHTYRSYEVDWGGIGCMKERVREG